MTGRAFELTRGVARTPFSGLSGRAFSRLAFLASAVFVIASAMCQPAISASINYGDYNGNNVKFIDVTETAITNDPLPLYGAPTVSGNSLSFSPQQFFAKSEHGAPISDTTDGKLTFMVQADDGQAISSINFFEGGSLSVTGLSSATNDTYVDVSALGFITVTAIDGVGVDPVALPIELIFNFGAGGNGTWRRAAEGSISGFLWNGSQGINITQELTNLGLNVVAGATKLNINLDNILFAQSEPVGSALIDKKLFLEITTTQPGGPGGGIPEPGTFVLLSCGLLGLATIGRRLGCSRN